MMIEQETELFLRFLRANGKAVAPEVAGMFVEAVKGFRKRSETLSDWRSLSGDTVDALFDDYHLFLASQDRVLLKMAEEHRKR